MVQRTEIGKQIGIGPPMGICLWPYQGAAASAASAFAASAFVASAASAFVAYASQLFDWVQYAFCRASIYLPPDTYIYIYIYIYLYIYI